MKIAIDPGLTANDRVRFTFEGAYMVTSETSYEYQDFDNGDGELHTVPTSRSTKYTVADPQHVWVESIDPEKIRERITGQWVNPDAIAVQELLDKANAANEALRATIASLRENYGATKELWKKRYAGTHLESASLDFIAAEIEEMKHPSPPDPYDY
jgi:hypothetical protein